jgi:hypothetical protein
MTRIISSVVGIGVLSLAVTANAQSLADIAKKDTDRRKTVKHPAKVYTNDDVQNVKPILPMMAQGDTSPLPPTANGETPAPANGQASSASGASGAAGAGQAPAAGQNALRPGVKSGEEAGWRARMQAARDAVSRTQLQLDGMRTRAAQLTAASAAANDDQRGEFQKRQQDALQEYDRLRADLQKNQKALADLESEAQRAGVPPGWLR